MGNDSPTPTTQEKLKQEEEIKKAFPLLADALIGNKIVGFTPEQFETLKNVEQQKLDGLAKAFGIEIKDSITKLAEALKVPVPAPTPSSKVEAAPVAIKSVNKEAMTAAATWLKQGADTGHKTFKLDKDEYLRSQGWLVDENSRILGHNSEALTTPTQPINYNRTPIFIPGGQLVIPIRPYVQVQPTGQGNGTVAFYTGTNATFGAINEGTAPSEDTITFAQVTASPTTRGTFIKVKYSTLEDNAFDAVNFLSMASMKASVDAEATEILDTIANAATPATGQWINANSGATLSSSDDVSGMTLTLTGVSVAKKALDVQGYMPQAPYTFALHPKNYNELIIASGISTFVQQGMPEVTRSGLLAALLGVNLVQYDQVHAQTNTSNNTYRNVMFVNQQAFGLGVAREVTVKAEEHSELQQLYWTATHRIVGKVLDNNAIVRVSAAQ